MRILMILLFCNEYKMEFIHTLPEEEEICANSTISKRDNSNYIHYFDKVNDKPWGKEYLAYQSKEIGIWILHVNRDQETSLHCHYKKDTILIPLSGCFKINLYNQFRILHLFEQIYVPRTTFHGIHSFVDDGILMEIEIYTENVEYTDKNDLLRIRDIYNRDKNSYETSVSERSPLLNEMIMHFSEQNMYEIGDTKITVLQTQNIEYLKAYDRVLLLKGQLYSNGCKLSAGSFLDLTQSFSLLTNTVDVLCLSNVNQSYLKKIIYSKSHLSDHLQFSRSPNIGLTSGCFDILHQGHISNLKKSAKLCNQLYVCLSSDEQIKRLKGNARPINCVNDRVHLLMHLECIDYIILYDETDDVLESELDNIMNIVQPETWFKGTDYTKDQIRAKHPCLKNIHLIEFVQGKSTTNIIQKITEKI
jgi:rfaE bifunctional protein nucleotidyltransferase chain/domain